MSPLPRLGLRIAHGLLPVAILAGRSAVSAQEVAPSSVVQTDALVVQAAPPVAAAASLARADLPAAEPVTGASWDQVTSRIANLEIESAGANSFGAITVLRGLANTPYFSDPAVTLYFDNIPLGGGFSYPTDLFGFGTASVFLGPQPTAFGRSGDGGVIVLSAEPFQNGGEIRAGIGDYGARTGAVSGGISEGAQADGSVAAAFSDRNGYIANTQINQSVDRVQAREGFARERYRPTAASEITVELLADSHRDGAAPLVPLNGPLYTVQRSQEGATDTDFFGAAVKGAVETGLGRLTAVTSYTNAKLNPYADWLVLPPPIQSNLQQSEQAWNEELRLDSAAGNAISWNLGAWLSAGSTAGSVDRTIAGVIPFEDSAYGYTRHEDAVFGELVLRPAAGWRLAVGGRLQRVAKVYHQDDFAPATGEPINLRRDDAAFLPTIAATRELADQTTVSARATLGTRPGGFAPYTDNPAFIPFAAEHIAAFEAGLRRVLAHPDLVLGVRGFDYEICNYQIERSFSAADYFVATAPRARSLGAEAQATWTPFAGGTVEAVAGLTDVRLLDFHDPITGQSFAGNRAPYTPTGTVGCTAAYHSARGWFVSVRVSAQGKTFYTESENPTYAQSPYAVVAARLGFETPRWRLTLTVDNAAAQGYYTLIIPGVNSAAPGAPRTIGSELAVKF